MTAEATKRTRSLDKELGFQGLDDRAYVRSNLAEDARAYQAACQNVVDAYRNGDLGVHARVRISGGGEGEAHDYVAVFEALMRNDGRTFVK